MSLELSEGEEKNGFVHNLRYSLSLYSEGMKWTVLPQMSHSPSAGRIPFAFLLLLLTFSSLLSAPRPTCMACTDGLWELLAHHGDQTEGWKWGQGHYSLVLSQLACHGLAVPLDIKSFLLSGKPMLCDSTFRFWYPLPPSVPLGPGVVTALLLVAPGPCITPRASCSSTSNFVISPFVNDLSLNYLKLSRYLVW